MSLLSPWYLLGILAVFIPLWLHLMWSRPKTRRFFSATLFLEPTQLPRKQKRRIEQFWLFILRCLILVSLAFAFSRPFLNKGLPPPLGPGNDQRQTIILIDRSASMRGDAWAEALAAVRGRISEMRFGDNIALAVYDRSLEQWVGFAPSPVWNENDLESRKNDLLGGLSTLSPSWHGTYTGRAVSEAVELLSSLEGTLDTGIRAQPEEPISLTREIVLISDFQEGSDFSDWWEGSLSEKK
ncbi:MAG: BatA domain-containing protein [Opitutales bacterium]|nr:BatA domain-containing protein [Opitutales bacterium]NRA27935.1 BatA domain-containing protein [Opitutales bacterium]